MNTPIILALVMFPMMFGSPVQEEKNTTFIIIYSPGENWDKTKSPGEQEGMAFHSRHLRQLRADGTIALGARYADKGMIIVRADTEEEATRLIKVDSAVIAKTFSAEVHRYAVFYDGCVSK